MNTMRWSHHGIEMVSGSHHCHCHIGKLWDSNHNTIRLIRGNVVLIGEKIWLVIGHFDEHVEGGLGLVL